MRIAEGYAEALAVVERASGERRPGRGEKIFAGTMAALAAAVAVSLFLNAVEPLPYVVGVLVLAIGGLVVVDQLSTYRIDDNGFHKRSLFSWDIPVSEVATIDFELLNSRLVIVTAHGKRRTLRIDAFQRALLMDLAAAAVQDERPISPLVYVAVLAASAATIIFAPHSSPNELISTLLRGLREAAVTAAATCAVLLAWTVHQKLRDR